MEIHFHIDQESVQSMSWEEYETFERAQDGDVKMYQLRPILARFILNGDGPMPHDKAMKMLGQLPISKIQETVEAFVGAIREGAIPKANGSSLSSPLEVAPAGSASPDGLEPSNKLKNGDAPPGKSPAKS